MKRCVVTSNPIENAAANDALANWCTLPISTNLPGSVPRMNVAEFAWFLCSGKSSKGGLIGAWVPIATGELNGG
jgi:hypothetical protein